jgi:H+/Cl- antiporter ClcA
MPQDIHKNLPSSFLSILKWSAIILSIGVAIGCSCALFLHLLDQATNYRENHKWIIGFLPLAGLSIGLAYHYWGKEITKGNSLLLTAYENPKKVIPFRMAPFILIGTLITHLFGGSAGREGTAVQMGGAIADQCTKYFKLTQHSRRTLIIMGISAGFSAVFGTPFAGALFALEVLAFKKINLKAVIGSILVAYVAHYTCISLGVQHTHYLVSSNQALNLKSLSWSACTGLIFGITALLFSRLLHFWNKLFSKTIKYPPFRPLFGGIFIVIAVWFLGTKYIGLGIPTIEAAFETQLDSYDFLLKILLTTFTLGVGFKGGEVTPLFFIGATLGNVLIWIVPLPLDLLAAMGFVAVFAGATHTPIACTIMAVELFGIKVMPFIAVSCCISYFFSGTHGIYADQFISRPKLYFHKKVLRRYKKEVKH